MAKTKKRVLSLVLSLAMLLTLLPATALAKGRDDSVTVTVTDEVGNPVSGAYVQVQYWFLGWNGTQTAGMTDDNGQVVLDRYWVWGTSYRVEVSKPGYYTARQDLTPGRDMSVTLPSATGGSYDLYCYTLVPGMNLGDDKPVDEKWNGMGVGSITNVMAPSNYAVNTVITDGSITYPGNTYPNIEANGKIYSYAAAGTPEANQAGHYTIEWIRTVVANGANTGANGYNPTAPSGTNTFHMDGQVFLVDEDLCNVTFRIMQPGGNTFEIQTDYSKIVAKGTSESTLAQPSTGDQTYNGVEYTFDGWYLDAGCTQKASFTGTIEANTDYYGKYVPKVTPPTQVTPVLTAQDKTYDGNTIVEYTLSLNGVTPGDDVTAVAASVTFEDEDAGHNKLVTATGITLQGADADKYQLTTDTATTEADIFQKPLTVTITPKDRVFNGSNEVEVTISGVGDDGKTPVGVIDGDDAYLDPVPTTGTMDTPDVGTGKEVKVNGPMLVGNEKDCNNYALIVNVGTVNIYPVDTNVVTVIGYTGMYNGQPHGVTASASLEGSTLWYSTDNTNWSETAPTFTNAGTYTVYVKATKANAADSPVASAQVVIGQRDVVLTSGSSSKTYDGLPLVNPNVTVSGSGFVAGEGAVYAVTGSQTSVGSSQNLFTYTLNAGTVATNYTITVRYGTLTVSDVYIPPYIPPVDPGTDIDDDDVPLADLPGLNTKDHYAYIAGYPDGTVQPNGNITRAEVATIFFRLFTEEYRNTFWSVSAPFTDVEATDWFNTEVATVASAGVVNGYPDGTFLPNNNITRAEFATIAARFLSEEYVGPDLFTDVSGHWAQEYINRAANAGWINGYPDGSFHPDAYITRAEAMTLVNNMLGRMPHEDHLLAGMKVWVDNPSTMWYYEAVQEATNGHDYDWAEDNAYEIWTALTPDLDWEALEALWAAQNA